MRWSSCHWRLFSSQDSFTFGEILQDLHWISVRIALDDSQLWLAIFSLSSHAVFSVDCIDGDGVLVLLVILALVQVHVVGHGAVDVLILVLEWEKRVLRLCLDWISSFGQKKTSFLPSAGPFPASVPSVSWPRWTHPPFPRSWSAGRGSSGPRTLSCDGSRHWNRNKK